MTAKPAREENRDTYLYFGNPVYQYSLKQGIEDGFLAPYRVHRVVTEWDAAGWRPTKDEIDRFGRLIPDEEYGTADFERVIAMRARTEAIASFGRGIFRGATKLGSDFAYKKLSRLHTGNLVYPKLMAWEGALAVVTPECNHLLVSPEFMVFDVDKSRILPETLDVYFRTPAVWPKLSGESTGTNVRRRRLHPEDFLTYKMPLPPMHAQKRLREVYERHVFVKPLRVQILKELEALLPSILYRAFNG